MSENPNAIAVFIDGENMSQKDFHYIDQEIRKSGRIIIYNIYADWSEVSMKKWMNKARENGLVCVQCDKISGKNSVDLRLSVDIMKYLYTNDSIDTYFLITSDSDYRHVLLEIKQKNKMVYCIGNSHVNPSLVAVCDTYMKIEDLRPDVQTPMVDVERFWDIIEHIVSNTPQCNMSVVKDAIMKSFPDFKHQDFGYTKFSDFLIDKFSSKLQLINGRVELI